METNMVIVMRNDKSKKEIKPLLIISSIEDARKIVENYKTIAKITKREVEYYLEFTPIVHC